MTEKIAVVADQATFKTRITYRELTYKLATRLLEEGEKVDDMLEGVLRAAAKEVEEPVLFDVADILRNKLGLEDYELSKVETFLVPETLNTVWRGIATKGLKEIRFYVERP